MPRATRNRTLIAQARVSEAELAEWRAKAAAAGVPLSELLRRAMARHAHLDRSRRKVERERTRELAPDRVEPEPRSPAGRTPTRRTPRRWKWSRIWSPSSGRSTL